MIEKFFSSRQFWNYIIADRKWIEDTLVGIGWNKSQLLSQVDILFVSGAILLLLVVVVTIVPGFNHARRKGLRKRYLCTSTKSVARIQRAYRRRSSSNGWSSMMLLFFQWRGKSWSAAFSSYRSSETQKVRLSLVGRILFKKRLEAGNPWRRRQRHYSSAVRWEEYELL